MRRKLIACGLLVALLLGGCKTTEDVGQKTGGPTSAPTAVSEKPDAAQPSEPAAALTPVGRLTPEPTDGQNQTAEPVLTEEAKPTPEQDPTAGADATKAPGQPTEASGQPTAGLMPTEKPPVEGGGNSTEAPEPSKTLSPTKIPTPGKTPTPIKTPAPTKTPTPGKTPTPIKTPAPTKTPVTTPSATATPKPVQTVGELEQITVNGKKISVGDSVGTLTAALGTPVRKDKADGSFTYYVYNKDYRNLSMIAVSDTTQKVVGFFVCSVNLGYGGLTSASTLSAFQSKYGAKAAAVSDLGARKLTDSKGTAVFFFDIHNDNTLYAVSYMAASVSWKETDAGSQPAVEKEILDICNAYRARYDIASLAWSDDAASIAKAYAKKMAAENFFSHTSPDGSTLASRTASLNYRTVGENIIANYMRLGHFSWKISGGVANATGWIASAGHRSNILNAAFTRLGVGITDGSTTSTYTDYGVQVFYTPR
ncbi:MAG: CAP domain-containing protein [Lachnospiraceae bacterium]|nr:CAP domain-containing protein [Lachnospiraceae bacterium]